MKRSVLILMCVSALAPACVTRSDNGRPGYVIDGSMMAIGGLMMASGRHDSNTCEDRGEGARCGISGNLTVVAGAAVLLVGGVALLINHAANQKQTSGQKGHRPPTSPMSYTPLLPAVGDQAPQP